MPYVKQLTKIGNSAGLVLDRAILKQVDLDVRSEVEIAVKDRSIVITPHRYASDEEAKASADKVFRARKALMRRLAK